MQYTTLGRSGIEVSRLCLGTMNFGGRTSADDAIAILDRAAAAGLNFIDTANVYGHDPAEYSLGRGRSEEIIGTWLRGRRDDFVVASKMYFPMRDEPGAMGPSARNIIRECEDSLRRLDTDYIDLYQLHHPSNDVPIDESLRALDQLVRSGKIRAIGTSSFGAWQIIESLWVSTTHHLAMATSEQPVYNLLDRRVERELLPMARTYGLGVITWSPLAGGVLAGRYVRDAAPGADSRHAEFWRTRHDALSSSVFDVVDALAQLADEMGSTLPELSYAWLLAQPGLSSVIVGPRTVHHLEAALDALHQPIDTGLRDRIDAIAPPGRVVFPQYGTDGLAWTPWGPHAIPWR